MLRRAVLVLLGCAPLCALAAPVPKEDEAARLARIYGTPHEFTKPDHCALDGDKLRVFVGRSDVPAFDAVGAPGRAVAVRRRRTDDSPVGAPRVWRDVKGDFTLTAKVAFQIASDRLRELDGPPTAGLLAWAEWNDFISLSRAGTERAAVGLRFTHPKGVRTGDAAPGSANLFLRLRRSGATVTSGYSSDGEKWEELFPDGVEWGDTIKVGVYVKNLSAPYEAVFSEYALTRAK